MGGLFSAALWFVIRQINEFTQAIQELRATLTALASDVRVERVHVMELQEWREKTADPILTQAMHMIYNNYRGGGPKAPKT